MPLLPAIAVLVLAQAFDYLSFLGMTARHGLGAELNPLVVLIAQHAGLPGLTAAKLATLVITVAAGFIVARRRPRLAFGVLILGVAAGIVGGLSNTATLFVF